MSEEQVGAAGVDRPGELDLLVGQVAVAVVGQQAGEDEQAVERRAQLVRHVGEELALVARGQGQLLGALLQGRLGQLDLLVLALHLGLLLREQLRAVGQLLVGGLQLLGQALRLLEELLGAHRRRDGVEHDADASRSRDPGTRFGWRENGWNAGQLDDRLDLLLEPYRQHHDAVRARVDPVPR